MRRICSRLLLRLASIGCLLLASSCLTADSGKNGDPGHLRYFGFALTACGVDDPHDTVPKTNYIDEVDEFVNIADLAVDSFENISDRVASLSSGNNLVFIHIAALFVEAVADKRNESGFRYVLFPDCRERWAHWRSANADLDLSKTGAFILPDEPSWNGLGAEELGCIAGIIKADYPAIPLLVVEAGSALDRLVLDDRIDWITFDEYGVLDPARDQGYREKISLLASRRTRSSQKLFMIMEAQWLPLYADLGYGQSVLVGMVESYFQCAKEEEAVIGIICYLLPGGFDWPDQLGFRNLDPEARAVYQKIGEKIVR